MSLPKTSAGGRALILICESEEQADEFEASAREFMPPTVEIRRASEVDL